MLVNGWSYLAISQGIHPFTNSSNTARHFVTVTGQLTALFMFNAHMRVCVLCVTRLAHSYSFLACIADIHFS